MPQRSKSFRFRVPWLSVPSESSSRRTKDRPKSPPHSDTSVPIQRPFKPSMVAPSELSPPSPTKIGEALNDEPKKYPKQTPPSSLIIESPVSTRPKPPSPQTPLQPSPHANSPPQVQVASSPLKTHLTSDNGAMKVSKPVAEKITPESSPFEQEKEKMVLSEPQPKEAEPKVKSPLTTITKSAETSFQPERKSTQPADSEQQVSSMPTSSPVSKTEPTTTTHPLSPLASKDIKTEETTQPSSPLALKEIKTEETAPQEEKEKMEVLTPQEEKPKIKSPLKTIPKSLETSSQPENLSTPPTKIEQRSTTLKAPLETQSKFLQPEEKEKVVHETTKARGKGKDTTTTASASGIATTKARDSSAKAFRGNKKHHGVRETVERKIMFATTNPIGKDTKVMSSTHEGTKNTSSSSISPEKTTSFSGAEAPPLQKGIKDDITKFVHKLTTSVHPTQAMDEKQFSVITLAGDNRGATMHLGSETVNKEGSIHIHRAYKSDHEEANEVTTDGDENTNEEEDEEVGMAYVNSNIQSINNSLMFNGSINERDPGVQVTLPQKPTEPIRPDDEPKPSLDTQKTQFNINRAKSSYQPTVGRSIRGCRFSCDQDIEDIEIL
ncbi:proteoglycan 4 [Cajanus cajan]|uniref:proteoglycan 4 n=1 Tax=Cajanus cajan TaxID=3821 RepID=UPI00098D80E1|nr:proteoglycan 4 [Cajanus cajan]